MKKRTLALLLIVALLSPAVLAAQDGPQDAKADGPTGSDDEHAEVSPSEVARKAKRDAAREQPFPRPVPATSPVAHITPRDV